LSSLTDDELFSNLPAAMRSARAASRTAAPPRIEPGGGIEGVLDATAIS
jgi:hypothetical protein